MSYENSFSIKVIGDPKIKIPVSYCPTCDATYECGTKFCMNDGEKLIDGIDSKPNDRIIFEFREKYDDSAHLIDDDGNSASSGSGYSIEGDLREFSKSYPEIVFQLDVTWDNGFGDPPSRDYFKGGLQQSCKTTITFDEYDESKLK